jgi:hypothetical protein
MAQVTSVNVSYCPYERKRVWLKHNQFDAFHAVVVEGCALMYPLSRDLPISGSPEIRYYDINYPDLNFCLFETDTYPPDGFISTYFYAADYIPGPFGNLGQLTGDDEFERHVSLHHGKIQHDPDHGKHNVSQRAPPRLRKSVFVEQWGVEAVHIFREGRPTNEFWYSMRATDFNLGTPGLGRLIRKLDLSPVTDSDIRESPAYARLCQRYGTVEFEHHYFHEQEFDPDQRRWRGFINAKVKTGFLSSTWQQIYLE